MTILFSVVRDFTEISERMQKQPEVLTRLMNRLLTSLSAEIMANNGTIDKYMGDSVMAFWNAPLSDPDHALDACKSALSMVVALDRLNRGMLEHHGKGKIGRASCRERVCQYV